MTALKTGTEPLPGLVGDSPAIQRIRELVRRAASTTASVLITGESGVGKEAVARAIHLQSPRAHRPFVVINCDAIPRESAGSELFGEAIKNREGNGLTRPDRLQEADGGTLYLDQVSEVSLAAQARLLRYLEHRETGRGGAQEPDVRVIAGSQESLSEHVKSGSFRQDLYHRLSVVTISVPPLRDRPEDLAALVAFFLDQLCRQHNRAVSLSPGCFKTLERYDWPGNVRELRRLLERVVVLAQSNPVESDEVESFLFSRSSFLIPRWDGPDSARREAVVRSLMANRSSRTRHRRPGLGHKLRRWLRKVPRRTRATLLVVGLLVLALVLLLVWERVTGMAD